MKINDRQNDSTGSLTSNQWHYFFEPVNETFSSSSLEWFKSVEEFRILSPAVNALPHIESDTVRKQAIKLLSNVHEIISFLITAKIDLEFLPPLKVCEFDDESISMEWAFPDFRVGFNIEVDEMESGWHLVANERLGYLMTSGSLSTDSKRLIHSLLAVILNNF